MISVFNLLPSLQPPQTMLMSKHHWFNYSCVVSDFLIFIYICICSFADCRVFMCRLQPNVDTRQKQLAAWCSLALSYCRHHKLYTLDVMEAQESPVFNNKKIERILIIQLHLYWLGTGLLLLGLLEFIAKATFKLLVYWVDLCFIQQV